MAGSVNKVILVGNLGKDPEIRITQNGKEMASFSIATSESWTDKLSGIRSEKTEWHNIVVFSEGLVRIVKDFVRKGNKVYIEGCLKTRKWVDQNNNERYITEVVLQNFNSTLTLLSSKPTSIAENYIDNRYPKNDLENKENTYEMKENSDEMVDEKDFIDDEIPF